jgi:hypothetical protein
MWAGKLAGKEPREPKLTHLALQFKKKLSPDPNSPFFPFLFTHECFIHKRP